MGWLWVIASPQYARAKPGSIFWAFEKASRASLYSKEWSRKTPSRKSFWAAARPEFGKSITAAGSLWAAGRGDGPADASTRPAKSAHDSGRIRPLGCGPGAGNARCRAVWFGRRERR